MSQFFGNIWFSNLIPRQILYYFGLLTITGSDEENKAILKIPNESIKRLYYDYIKKTYEETGILTLDTGRSSSAAQPVQPG
jgi:hypothetical protein